MVFPEMFLKARGDFVIDDPPFRTVFAQELICLEIPAEMLPYLRIGPARRRDEHFYVL